MELDFAMELDFDVAVRAVRASGEQIHAGVADFGEFHVGPVDDVAEEEFR
jgi:hypothetical protein